MDKKDTPEYLGKMTNNKFPRISKSQFAVMLCEVETGIVLNTKFERFIGEGDCYFIFDSIDESIRFAKKIVADNSKLEIVIYNSEQNTMKVISNL